MSKRYRNQSNRKCYPYIPKHSDMVDWEDLQKKARKDLDSCFKIWKIILEEFFGDLLQYAYAKGSCNKEWNSIIDYIPLLSDVDIHVKRADGKLLCDSMSFSEALEISKRYEDMFKASRPDSLHLPRMQVISIDRLLNSTEITYVPPMLKDTKTLYGKSIQEKIPSAETIRKIDRESIERQEAFILSLPERIFDRTGLDFWGVIRCGGLGWRVSPSPYRLLSQVHSEPIEVWSWNRTKVSKELKNFGYEKIANLYRSFYENCWKIFLSDFKDSDAYRALASDGYWILTECLTEVTKI